MGPLIEGLLFKSLLYTIINSANYSSHQIRRTLKVNTKTIGQNEERNLRVKATSN